MSETTVDDLVVVGGGVAGCTAALTAARTDPSASVRVLCPAEDRFGAHSGLIDVLGYRPGREEPVSDPFSAIDELPDSHWYSKLGPERLREALAVFDDATGYGGVETDENALFPTAVGSLKPASRYPDSIAAGVASDRQPMRLVGFEQVPDFDVELAADRLTKRLPYEVTGTSITPPFPADEVPPAPAIADALDENGETGSGESLRESLTNALRSELDVEPRLGVPAVLGVDEADAIRAALETRLHADIFEVPIGPPSIPGRRLESRLSAALDEAGVAVQRGVSLSDIEASDGQIDAVRTAAGTCEGAAFVLATGGIQAGGLESTRDEIHEPLFDAPVRAPSDRREWVDNDFLGDHEAIRVGVQTDDQLRPAGTDGPQYSNLYAAGQILETTNVVAEQSADGVAIVTGHEAGLRAVEET